MAECFFSWFRALFGSACLALIVTGCGGGGSARSYGLSEVTVKHHLKSLRIKLGAKKEPTRSAERLN